MPETENVKPYPTKAKPNRNTRLFQKGTGDFSGVRRPKVVSKVLLQGMFARRLSQQYLALSRSVSIEPGGKSAWCGNIGSVILSDVWSQACILSWLVVTCSSCRA